MIYIGDEACPIPETSDEGRPHHRGSESPYTTEEVKAPEPPMAVKAPAPPMVVKAEVIASVTLTSIYEKYEI
jgi:hypothetical protein